FTDKTLSRKPGAVHSAQQQQLTSWQEQGHDIFPLGI
ncbi:TPA: hypothetical protein ACGD47_001950, partial [Shigella flexneri]